MPDRQWHYMQAGQRLGPVTFDMLRDMADLGHLAATDLVWTEGMRAWRPADGVPGLFGQGLPPPDVLEGSDVPSRPPDVVEPDSASPMTLAVGSLLFALIGIPPLGLLTGPIAAILGTHALRAMERVGRPHGHALALTGTILGILEFFAAGLFLLVRHA